MNRMPTILTRVETVIMVGSLHLSFQHDYLNSSNLVSKMKNKQTQTKRNTTSLIINTSRGCREKCIRRHGIMILLGDGSDPFSAPNKLFWICSCIQHSEKSIEHPKPTDLLAKTKKGQNKILNEKKNTNENHCKPSRNCSKAIWIDFIHVRNIVRCAAVACIAWPPILPTRYVCNIQLHIRRNLIIQNIQSHVYARVRERIRCTSFSVIFRLPLFIRFISRIWRFCKNRWKMPRFIAMMANDDEMNMSPKTKQKMVVFSSSMRRNVEDDNSVQMF